MEYGREQILVELEAEISSMKMKLSRMEEIVAKLKISDATSSSYVDVPEVADTNFNTPSDVSQSHTGPSAAFADTNVAEESHIVELAVGPVDELEAIELAGSPVDELEAIELAGNPFDESVSDNSDDEINESSTTLSTSHISESETSETETLDLKMPEPEMSEPEMFEPETSEPEPSEPETLEDVWNMQAEAEEENEDTEEGADGGNVINSIGPKFWLTDIAGIPVKDLRSAISMNDKILFINTLFNEDPVLYQDVVRRINGMESFSEALNYLIPNFKSWNLDSDVVYRFMMAVRRRLK